MTVTEPPEAARKSDGQIGPGADLSRRKIIRAFELSERVRLYAPGSDTEMINRAYVYAVSQHGTQKRKSGEPYFHHPVAVSAVLVDLKLDVATIVAALLHDTVEDTEATQAELSETFSPEVARLVDGVTKLRDLEYQSAHSKQAQNFQKFILASVKDLRVLLIKLADRLHNMRTIGYLSNPQKRLRIANETIEIYAPLARQVGLYSIAAELEDLSFAEINAEGRASILARLETLELESSEDLENIRQQLSKLLVEAGVHVRITGRRKQPYSISQKMKRKDIRFRDVADIFAYRLIVPTVDDCYRTLQLVHLNWKALNDRFRDYISWPKVNGYRSIHTTIYGPGNRKIELQIRTEAMHATAEKGIAAHWAYKNDTYGFDPESARASGLDIDKFLTAFEAIISDGADPQETFEHAKLEMYHDHVFTFTPKGRLVTLPQGAMPLDFAYRVHTRLGDTCCGCRINGETRPLKTVLKTGDVVEILRSEAPSVIPGWEALTRTGRAKSAIKRLVRTQRRDDFVSIGRRHFEHALHRIGLVASDLNMENIAHRVGEETADDLYHEIGTKNRTTNDVLMVAFPGHAENLQPSSGMLRLSDETAQDLISISGLPTGGALTLCKMCCPLPGDRIVGTQENAGPIIVHAIDCGSLESSDDAEIQWYDMSWLPDSDSPVSAHGRIVVSASNKRGVLAKLCGMVADGGGNIIGVQTTGQDIDFIDLLFDIEVEDLRHLSRLLASLQAMSVVDSAERMRT